MSGEGFILEDVVVRAISALNEVESRVQEAFVGVDEVYPLPSLPLEPGQLDELDREDFEGFYFRDQLDRIRKLAGWMRDDLENLTEEESVERGAERMMRRVAERGGDA